MRRPMLAIGCIVVSFSAHTQTIGSEILSGIIAPRDELAHVAMPAIALARDRHGTAIAWAARGAGLANTIYVARIDDAGGLTGSIHEIPTAQAGVQATAPSIAAAPDGDGFTLAWIEASSPAPLTGVYCRLDRNLVPTRPRVLTTLPADISDSPVIVRSNKSTWITTAGLLWEIGPGDLPGPAIVAGAIASDMTAATPLPVIISSQRVQSAHFVCRGDFGCVVFGGPFNGFCQYSCRVYPSNYVLQLTSIHGPAPTQTFPFDSDKPPAVQSNGRDILAVWFNGDSKAGGPVAAARVDAASVQTFLNTSDRQLLVGTFGPNDVLTRPDIATDGERYVVVWQTVTAAGDHDVVGAAIDPEGKVAKLILAASTADERDPSVLAIGRGRFLIAYERMALQQRRLAGRFVSFESRRRAVQ